VIVSPLDRTEPFDGELVVEITKAVPVVNESFNKGENEIEASSSREIPHQQRLEL
jgi:hypothetical protein